MFSIRLSEGAWTELSRFRRTDQVRLLEEIESHLRTNPTVRSKRIKLLSGAAPSWSQTAPVWQLRVEPFRVFYDVDTMAQAVVVQAIRLKGRKTTEEIL